MELIFKDGFNPFDDLLTLKVDEIKTMIDEIEQTS